MPLPLFLRKDNEMKIAAPRTRERETTTPGNKVETGVGLAGAGRKPQPEYLA